MSVAEDTMEAKSSTSASVFTIRNMSLVVVVLAIVISGYLSYLKVAPIPPVCVNTGRFDCGTVLNSAYSEIGDIPIAWMGLATNLIVLTLLLLEYRLELLEENGVILIFGVVLFATLFSVWLVYVQAFRLRAFCQWCLTHEFLIFTLFGLSITRLIRYLREEPA